MMNNNQLPPVPRGTLLSEAWRHFMSCLAKENYARLQGRAGRMEYWSATIIGYILTPLPLLFCVIPSLITFCIGILLFLVLVFYLTMPMLAVYVRRVHDVGWSGKWIALSYAIYCIPFAYVTFFSSSTIANDITILEEPLELYYLLREECNHLWFFCVLHLAEILNLILFVVTLNPGTKGLNKYDL